MKTSELNAVYSLAQGIGRAYRDRAFTGTREQFHGISRSECGFNSYWYPYESLVAAGKASILNRSRVPVKSLPW